MLSRSNIWTNITIRCILCWGRTLDYTRKVITLLLSMEISIWRCSV